MHSNSISRFKLFLSHRYRKFDLGNGIDVIVRCEHDAVILTGNEKQFITIKALNEWDSKVSLPSFTNKDRESSLISQ